MSDISIVIRCYNEEKHIGRLLTGIAQQTIKDVEIIIVDSGSTDATLDIVSRFPVKILHIRSDEFSFGRSLNIGCDVSQSDIIVVASAHVYPIYIDWLERLVAPFDDPNVALVYGKQIGNEKTKFSENQIFEKWFPEETDLNQNHPFCNNANAAIRKLMWQKLPYDESLTGLEDLDWAHRATQAGKKIIYEAGAVVVHEHNETPSATYNRYRREGMAFKRIFMNERFNLMDFITLYISNVKSDFLHAIYQKVFWRNWFDILRFRLMQFCGTYRGFTQSIQVTNQLRQKFYYSNQKQPKLSIRNELVDEKMIDYKSGNRLYRENN